MVFQKGQNYFFNIISLYLKKNQNRDHVWVSLTKHDWQNEKKDKQFLGHKHSVVVASQIWWNKTAELNKRLEQNLQIKLCGGKKTKQLSDLPGLGILHFKELSTRWNQTVMRSVMC